MFKYQSGEVIELNDVVNYTGFGIGVVEEIFEPYSLSAKGMRLPHGGVMVQFPDERRVLLDTTEDEEDLELIRRKEIYGK